MTNFFIYFSFICSLLSLILIIGLARNTNETISAHEIKFEKILKLIKNSLENSREREFDFLNLELRTAFMEKIGKKDINLNIDNEYLNYLCSRQYSLFIENIHLLKSDMNKFESRIYTLEKDIVNITKKISSSKYDEPLMEGVKELIY